MSATKLLARAARLRSHAVRNELSRLIDSTISATADSLASNAKNHDAYYRLISVVRAKANLLQPAKLHGARGMQQIKSVTSACARLAETRLRWVRQPELWQPDFEPEFQTAREQLRSLVDHLLVKQEVPPFLYQCWFDETNCESSCLRKLFLHMALEHSVRGTEVGKHLSRAMANRLNSAPHDATIADAIEFARTGVAKSVRRVFPPCTSRRRRNAITKKHVPSRVITWEKIPVDDFFQTESITGQDCRNRTWIIRQLTDENQLRHEGERMQHCVGCYWLDCVENLSSIWTMECRDEIRTRGLLTIEVAPTTRTIVQIKGYRNRRPRQKELEIVKRWACKELLQIF